MSDVSGTTSGNDLEDQDVAQTVAEDEDDDPVVLKRKLAEEREARKKLESNIGRQNDIHGKRLKEKDDRVDALERQLRELREAQERNLIEAKRSQLSPTERVQFDSDIYKTKTEALEQELENVKLLGQVRAEAQKLGMPLDDLDERSPQHALISIEEWKQRERDRELQDLKKELQELKKDRTRVVEEVTDAVRGATGARTATTGSLSTPPPPKLTAEQQSYVDRFNEAVRRKDKAKMFSIKSEAALKGIILEYDPRS